MKKVIGLAAIPFVIAIILLLDYYFKKKKFNALETEYKLSTSFEQVVGKINIYFFEHGSFPDSLGEVDSVFRTNINDTNLDAIRNTPYRFLIDPFTGDYFQYIPVVNSESRKAEGFFLLSGGIDGKIDNTTSTTLRLYDTLTFNYWDCYFGSKDLLIAEGSIRDWINESEGFDFTLNELAKKYDPSGKRPFPRVVNFVAVVDEVHSDFLKAHAKDSRVGAECYFAPFSSEKSFSRGDTVRITGLFNSAQVKEDTVFRFFNCVLDK